MSGALRSLQARLAEVFARPAPLASDPGAARLAEEIALDAGVLSPLEQLEVYREQFWLRHLDCLRDDYASLVWLLGDDAFDQLARDYVAACPPASFTLRDVGARLPAFLHEHPAGRDPLAVELARVEWAFVEAFDAPDEPLSLDPEALSGRSEDEWESARVVLDPSLRPLSLEHPAHDFRIAARRNERPERPASRRCHVVVYRGPELLYCREVDAVARALLVELASGARLGEACERASAPRAEIGAWFSEWTSLGWVRAVRFSPTP